MNVEYIDYKPRTSAQGVTHVYVRLHIYIYVDENLLISNEIEYVFTPYHFLIICVYTVYKLTFQTTLFDFNDGIFYKNRDEILLI